MTPEAIRLLFGYTYAAFDKVWDCILSLTDAQFVEDLPYSIGSIRNHVVHLMSAERRWVARLQPGTPLPDQIKYGDFSTKAAVSAHYEQIRADVLTYINALDETALNAVIDWNLPHRGIAERHPRYALLLHLANHATDHRSQILAMIHSHFTAPTVEHDLVFYLLEQEKTPTDSK